IVAIDHRFSRLVVPRAESKKRGRDLRFGVAALDLVAGELLGEETIVRPISIQRIDHVIVVTPGVRLAAVTLVAIRFGIAGDIKPMSGPSLAILRTRQ